ncbi:MAG: galactose-1-phosphate uridylyltransferase [Armatimonadia bacterium]|nr:galactose-1-phosphate uridylyltransferase [Armatimonadia bacterium]
MPEIKVYRSDVLRTDARTLRYYDPVAVGEGPPRREAEGPAEGTTMSRGPEMRYNPLLGDYTVCAGFRMDRPQLPPSDKCPLCVGGYEAPQPYSVTVFDNRFPSMVMDPAPPDPGPHPPTDVRPAVGKCEVICYSPEHDNCLASLDPEQLHVLTHAWCDRFVELSAHPAIECVLIFENRGEDVGVTLHHPHGQLYAFSLVPPRVLAEKQNAERASSEGRCIFCDVIEGEKRSGARILHESSRYLAVMPFYARLPYEIHIYAKDHSKPSMAEMDAEDKRELAAMLGLVTGKYEALFEGPMQYMMLFHQLRACEGYHFHVEFYPMRRSETKLKYAASVETGGGLWLNDAYPEQTIEHLRAAGPSEPVFAGSRIVAVEKIAP